MQIIIGITSEEMVAITIPTISIQFCLPGLMSFNAVYCKTANIGIFSPLTIFSVLTDIAGSRYVLQMWNWDAAKQWRKRHPMQSNPRGNVGVSNIAIKIIDSATHNTDFHKQKVKGSMLFNVALVASWLAVMTIPLMTARTFPMSNNVCSICLDVHWCRHNEIPWCCT